MGASFGMLCCLPGSKFSEDGKEKKGLTKKAKGGSMQGQDTASVSATKTAVIPATDASSLIKQVKASEDKKGASEEDVSAEAEEGTAAESSKPELDSRAYLLSRLSELQLKVMLAATARAQIASDAAVPDLEERLQKLGYDKGVLAKILKYVREEAPLVINFDPNKDYEGSTVLSNFLLDTHYRNGFETGISHVILGSGRIDKEDALSEGLYHEFVSPSERPKYGSVNLFQRKDGSAPDYGRCYLELQADVRRRCTLIYYPKQDNTKAPGTYEHFAHVLASFDDEQLRCLIERRQYEGSDQITLEAHVHGPVAFQTDVKALHFPKSIYHSRRLRRRMRRWANRVGFVISPYDQ